MPPQNGEDKRDDQKSMLDKKPQGKGTETQARPKNEDTMESVKGDAPTITVKQIMQETGSSVPSSSPRTQFTRQSSVRADELKINISFERQKSQKSSANQPTTILLNLITSPDVNVSISRDNQNSFESQSHASLSRSISRGSSAPQTQATLDKLASRNQKAPNDLTNIKHSNKDVDTIAFAVEYDNGSKIFEISFDFKTQEDTPESIAAELSALAIISENHTESVKEKVKSKIEEVLNNRKGPPQLKKPSPIEDATSNR